VGGTGVSGDSGSASGGGNGGAGGTGGGGGIGGNGKPSASLSYGSGAAPGVGGIRIVAGSGGGGGSGWSSDAGDVGSGSGGGVGGASAGGQGGVGGAGGGAEMKIETRVDPIVDHGEVRVHGGRGGYGGSGHAGAGGAGGSATLVVESGVSIEVLAHPVSIRGGDGGGNAGGAGGSMQLTLGAGSSLSTTGDLEIHGGNGGGGSATGGKAALVASDVRLSVGGDLEVRGGANSVGLGGDASLRIDGNASRVDVDGDLAVDSSQGGSALLDVENTAIRIQGSGKNDISVDAGAKEAKFTLKGSSLTLDGNLSLRAGGAQARMSADANSPVLLGGDLRVEGSANADASLDFGATLTLAGTLDRTQPQTIAAVHGGTGASINLAGIDVREHTWLTSNAAGNSFKLGQARVFDDKDLRIFNAPGEIEIGDLTLAGKGRVYVEDPMRPGVRGMTLNAHGGDLSVITQASVGAYGSTGLPVLAVDHADIRNANLSVDDAPYKGRIALTRDQYVRLIQTDKGVAASTYYYRTRTSLGDRFSIDVRGKNVDLSLMSPSLKSYTEAAAAGLSFVGQGAYFVLNRGMGSALKATSGAGTRSEFFSEFGYDQHRYETGSYVKVRGGSLVAGIARGSDVGDGRATVGAFFESGWGNYDTYNSFPQTPAVEGDGKLGYYGLGVLARYDDPSGFHADTAFRVGQSKTDFSTGDIRYTTVNQGLGKAHFETDAMYYSLVAGVGHQLKLFDRTTLDVSTHLLWTRQSENSTKVHFDKLKFDAADSLRSRIGARVTYALNERADLYAGAYWDREHKGDAKASLNGMKIYDAATLRGDTRIGEIGVHIKPAKVSNFSLDLNAQTYAGEKKGASANLRFKWVF
jgi:hypothetical protein